jgi:hypothetical protein
LERIGLEVRIGLRRFGGNELHCGWVSSSAASPKKPIQPAGLESYFGCSARLYLIPGFFEAWQPAVLQKEYDEYVKKHMAELNQAKPK